MILISPAQCRAARALLNWSQPDLAERCGMNVQTISAFEKDTGSPTKTTLQKISEVLEQSGVEFGANNGVSISTGKTYILDTYYEVLNDVMRTFPNGGEVLLHCADENRSPPHVIEKIHEVLTKNITFRATICEGNTNRRDGIPSKWIPKEYFADSEVFVIYDDKFVIPIGIGPDAKFMTIKNKILATAMRRQFEYWWKNGKEIPKP